ncbi:hypothetical protein [Acidiphilium acidophilum]|uniref:Uncharacterized protein n=1 Tax=Acidiphilium acidophilum TaxID=76588 RepID=A0AAW9DUV7_ACIAO|nr:hypothetical protein [Acidiphilium acidophilum]MDX5932490.1 hypothetical protein [Acidiphilium acidophilum]
MTFPRPMMDAAFGGLRLGAHLMAHRTASHKDDRVMPVLSGDKLKACGGQMMALIDDKIAAIGNDIINLASANQALDQPDVDDTGGFADLSRFVSYF